MMTICGSLWSICGSVITVGVRVRVRIRIRVEGCCIQTAGESGDKTRVNHVIKTDQWRDAPQIRRAPHFVVSREKVENQPSFVNLFRFSISASFSSTPPSISRSYKQSCDTDALPHSDDSNA